MESVELGTPLPLEENLTVTAVPALMETLNALKNTPLAFDASYVKHLDWPVLQVLLAAARHWKSNHIPFEITNISESFQHGLDTLGVELNAISNAETA